MQVVPGIYQLALLALIGFRLWRLLAEDEITERPRRWLVRLPQDWISEQPVPRAYRDGLAGYISCPWCLGAATSLVAYLGWMFTIGNYPDTTSEVFTAIGIWFAISAAVGLIRVRLDPPEE